MAAATKGTTWVDGQDLGKLLYVATLEFKAAPFRADKLALAYLPAVPLVLDYGAKSYSYYRDDQDSELITHVSVWEDKVDFEQFWFSHELQQIRTAISGMYALPLSPHWHTVIEQSAVTRR